MDTEPILLFFVVTMTKMN